MARRYRDAVTALEALDVEADFDVFDQLVTRNLEATIRDGDSLIDDPAYTAHPFDWRAAFPSVFAAGGFDVVIGNPPYVRMEHLKDVKPYLAERYVVAADRADLYAYFFEKGVAVLKPGGRLGYISSSTFFKTGSGQNLRTFLGDGVALEAVVDFGDVQVFEGVTTYPAILTLKKEGGGGEGDLTFLTVRGKVPEDLDRAFARDGQAMPRARLGKGSWQLEGDALAALRAKLAAGRQTLGEVYGPPLYGIKTGLNEAFVISRETRDALVKADAKSAELAYQATFAKPKIIYQDITASNPFALDETGAFPANTCYFLPTGDRTLLGILNSRLAWFFLSAVTNIARGGYLRLRTEFVAQLPLPTIAAAPARALGNLVDICTDAARRRFTIQSDVRRRILDLAPPDRRSLTNKLAAWHDLDFTAFRAEARKAFGADIPLKARAEWEAFLAENAATVHAHTAHIAEAEREIDGAVYGLFDLAAGEVALLEGSVSA